MLIIVYNTWAPCLLLMLGPWPKSQQLKPLTHSEVDMWHVEVAV